LTERTPAAQLAAVRQPSGTTGEEEIDELVENPSVQKLPRNFEAVDAFAVEVSSQLESGEESPPSEKRRILELRRVRVFDPKEDKLWHEG